MKVKTMSKYTTELRHLVDSGYDLELDEYPIFDETYRAALNAKIIKHYQFREIGAETADRFREYLKTTLAEIMPYYNQLYVSAALSINPLYTQDMTETSTQESTAQGTNVNTSETTVSNEDEGLNIESDMPQSMIAAADIMANTYASKANRSENTTNGLQSATSENSAANTSINLFTRRLFGCSGKTGAEMLLEYRKTFLNIDMLVIEDLESCFMGIY
jgi:hypothetical protein